MRKITPQDEAMIKLATAECRGYQENLAGFNPIDIKTLIGRKFIEHAKDKYKITRKGQIYAIPLLLNHGSFVVYLTSKEKPIRPIAPNEKSHFDVYGYQYMHPFAKEGVIVIPRLQVKIIKTWWTNSQYIFPSGVELYADGWFEIVQTKSNMIENFIQKIMTSKHKNYFYFMNLELEEVARDILTLEETKNKYGDIPLVEFPS